jgi:hypothetical protein
LGKIGAYGPRQVFRRTRRRIEPLLHQRVADPGITEQRVDLCVEQRHLVFRQPWGTEQRIPDVDVDVGDALVGERWNLGRHRRASRAAGGQHAQFSILHLRQGDVNGKEHQLHLPAQKVGHRTRSALVRNVDHVDPEVLLEQLHREMVRGAAARRRIVELPRLSLGERDELLDRSRRQRRMDDQREAADRGGSDRRESIDRVIRNARLQRDVGNVRARGHQQRVAVGGCLGHGLGADVAARAGAIVYDHGNVEFLGELLAEHARQDVDARARRVRHDHANRTVRIRFLRRRGTERGKARHDAQQRNDRAPQRRSRWRRTSGINGSSHHRVSAARKPTTSAVNRSASSTFEMCAASSST